MWYEFGHTLLRWLESRGVRILVAVCLGIAAAVFEAILDTWLTRQASKEWRLALDAGSVGLLVAVLTYLEIAALRFRRERIDSELRLVGELNHRVRNALQTIAYAARLPEAKNQVEIIEDCVRRIDGALRELFPSRTSRENWESRDRPTVKQKANRP